MRDEAGQETTTLELFFDLVYVLAVTQLSHLLIGDLSWHGAGQAAFLLAVMWWAWVNTTWLLNWLDPGSLPVRVLVLAGALASLLMAAALPTAFGHGAVLFAGAYVAFGVGRNVAALVLTRAHELRGTFAALLAWAACAAPFWLGGAAASGGLRTVLWGTALLLELLAPLVGYRLPGRPRIDAVLGLALEGGHFADRFQGFVIIALGESIVVTGATAADHGLTARVAVALSVAFTQTAAMWWLYFGTSAVYAKQQMRSAADAVALARDGYTYLHLPIVAGVILTAVGDDFLLADPLHRLSAAQLVATLGGPILYLAGTLAFRWRMIGRLRRKRPVAIVALLLAGAAGPTMPALALAALTAVILAGTVAWEERGDVGIVASQTN